MNAKDELLQLCEELGATLEELGWGPNLAAANLIAPKGFGWNSKTQEDYQDPIDLKTKFGQGGLTFVSVTAPNSEMMYEKLLKMAKEGIRPLPELADYLNVRIRTRNKLKKVMKKYRNINAPRIEIVLRIEGEEEVLIY